MNDNRSFFRDTVERILADTLTPADVEAAEEGRLPRALIRALDQNGILTMLAPEAQGGIGATLTEAFTILRALGAAAAPGPALETILGQSLLAQAGLDIDGTLALAFVTEGSAPEAGATQWTAPPRLAAVPWARLADRIVAILPAGGGTRLAVSAPADWTVATGADAAGEPRDDLSAAVVPVRVADLPDLPFDTVVATAAVLRAGQMLGALEWILARSVDYAMERRQFGREIGKFQVVQQMLAELSGHVLAARAIAEAAAEGFTPVLVAAALSRLGDAADAAITIGHQVHGAIGFSREYTLNHRTRRLMAWRDDFRTVPAWRRHLAGGFAGLDHAALWPAITKSGLRKLAAE
ncbi:MAG: acyl-CoA/acyl-ACP dehydrogenase [Azospirillaceae bacterium]|nr:acyl-CoA/acyl-ACP dehydrogenase [Azospirillaceae bacterium]